MNCKFEEGKEYKTRDGSIAKIFMIQNHDFNAIIGAKKSLTTENWLPAAWTINGKWLSTKNSTNDLIPPPRELWVNHYENDNQYFVYKNKKAALEAKKIGKARETIRYIEAEDQNDEF